MFDLELRFSARRADFLSKSVCLLYTIQIGGVESENNNEVAAALSFKLPFQIKYIGQVEYLDLTRNCSKDQLALQRIDHKIVLPSNQRKSLEFAEVATGWGEPIRNVSEYKVEISRVFTPRLLLELQLAKYEMTDLMSD